ncbi:MAG TPA: SRPBCC family protein [Longimicrobium sp.]|nr:SRPBCC family protein [Longimicrobium sp.]
MTTSQAPVVVRVQHRYRHPAERVFDAWLDPRLASRFLYATPDGAIVRCDLDARVGGRWSIVDRRDGEDVDHTGEYLEIGRPRRLVFTFGVPKYASWFDRVEIDITPVEGGGCELVLTHTLAPEGAEWAEGTRDGWAGILRGLETVLEGEAS